MHLFIDDELIPDACIETLPERFARDADNNLTAIKTIGKVLVRSAAKISAAERVRVRVVERNAEWRFSAIFENASPEGFYLYPTGAIQQQL